MLHRIILVLTLLVAVSCTGDDETVELEQCYNGTTANITEGEECPEPPPQEPSTPPAPPTTPPTTPPEPGADSGECNLRAEGKTPFTASSNDDVICGDDDDNTINALGGEDVVRAKGGDDIVDGGEHDDEIYGEAGDDTLDGGQGEDILDGGPGNDILIGGENDDKLMGGDGSDTVRYIGTVNEMVNDEGVPTGTEVNLDINLADGYSNDEYGDQDEYINIENVEIVGVSTGSYTITGNERANRLTGGPGSDTINGEGGNDIIDGGGGTDTIDGGEGSDTLVVGATFDLSSATGLTSIENLQAATGNAAINLTGDSDPNILTGNAGVNQLTGAGGKDTLTGGGGGDCFVLASATSPTAPGVAATVDNITDYNAEEGDIIDVPGGSALDDTRAVSQVYVSGGRILVIVTQAAPDADPVVQEVTATLANVRGRGLTSSTVLVGGCNRS